MLVNIRRILYLSALLILLQNFTFIVSCHASGLLRTPEDWKYKYLWSVAGLLVGKTVLMVVSIYQILLLSLFDGYTYLTSLSILSVVVSAISFPSIFSLLFARFETTESNASGWAAIICYPCTLTITVVIASEAFLLGFIWTSILLPVWVFWIWIPMVCVATKNIITNQASIPMIIQWNLQVLNIDEYNATVRKDFPDLIVVGDKTTVSSNAIVINA